MIIRSKIAGVIFFKFCFLSKQYEVYLSLLMYNPENNQINYSSQVSKNIA
jgi:hypothetical protein